MERGFFYGRISETEIRLNPAELAARLQTEKGFSHALFETCEAKLRGVLDCRYSARRVPLAFLDGEGLDLGGIRTESHSLRRNLSGCGEVFLFAVTLGMGVDRLLHRLSFLSEAEYFITDALSSAAAEAACDQAEAELRQGLACRPRFSPGYGDLPLAVQPELLAAVDAQKLLGITLSTSLLMTPTKTITAIMGVCDEEHQRSNTE